MTNQKPGEQDEHAASVLAAEIDVLSDPDVAGLGRSLAAVLGGAMDNPAAVSQALLRYTMRLAAIPPVTLPDWLAAVATQPAALSPEDHRNAEHGKPDGPGYSALRMYHQAFAEFADQLVSLARLEPSQQVKARLLTGLVMDTLAPDNFLTTSRRAGGTGRREPG